MGLETPETERVDIPEPEPLRVPSVEPHREPEPAEVPALKARQGPEPVLGGIPERRIQEVEAWVAAAAASTGGL